MNKFLKISITAVICASMTSCDTVRKFIGRPSSDEMEQKLKKIERIEAARKLAEERSKAVADSIKAASPSSRERAEETKTIQQKAFERAELESKAKAQAKAVAVESSKYRNLDKERITDAMAKVKAEEIARQNAIISKEKAKAASAAATAHPSERKAQYNAAMEQKLANQKALRPKTASTATEKTAPDKKTSTEPAKTKAQAKATTKNQAAAPAQTTSANTAAPKKAETKKQEPQVQLPAATNARFDVVLGTFILRSNAVNLCSKVKERGYDARLVDEGDWTAVFAACPYPDKEDAYDFFAEIKKESFCPSDAWLRHR